MSCAPKHGLSIFHSFKTETKHAAGEENAQLGWTQFHRHMRLPNFDTLPQFVREGKWKTKIKSRHSGLQLHALVRTSLRNLEIFQTGAKSKRTGCNNHRYSDSKQGPRVFFVKNELISLWRSSLLLTLSKARSSKSHSSKTGFTAEQRRKNYQGFAGIVGTSSAALFPTLEGCARCGLSAMMTAVDQNSRVQKKKDEVLLRAVKAQRAGAYPQCL